MHILYSYLPIKLEAILEEDPANKVKDMLLLPIRALATSPTLGKTLLKFSYYNENWRTVNSVAVNTNINGGFYYVVYLYK